MEEADRGAGLYSSSDWLSDQFHSLPSIFSYSLEINTQKWVVDYESSLPNLQTKTMNPLSNINTLLNAVLPIWQADQEENNNVEREENAFVATDDDSEFSGSDIDSELDILLAGGEPVSQMHTTHSN